MKTTFSILFLAGAIFAGTAWKWTNVIEGAGIPAAIPTASACPVSVFGHIDPRTTAVTDASTPASLMATLFNDPALNQTEPLVMVHYMPGLTTTPSYNLRTQPPFGPGLAGTLGCEYPGAPVIGSCGWYRATEYDQCDFPTNANLTLGGLDLGATYTDSTGVFVGCKDKIVSTRYVCYLRSTPTSPPAKVDCSTCPNQVAACPAAVFGDINPHTTAVTDASTPASLMATLFNDPALNQTEPLVMVHYMPGLSVTPSYKLRTQPPFGPGLAGTLGCEYPGAPVIGSCGWYRVTEYDQCDFPKNANLTLGGLDLGANYTDSNGVFLGCSDKIVSTRFVCYLRSTPTSPPTKVNCSTCPDQLA